MRAFKTAKAVRRGRVAPVSDLISAFKTRVSEAIVRLWWGDDKEAAPSRSAVRATAAGEREERRRGKRERSAGGMGMGSGSGEGRSQRRTRGRRRRRRSAPEEEEDEEQQPAAASEARRRGKKAASNWEEAEAVVFPSMVKSKAFLVSFHLEKNIYIYIYSKSNMLCQIL
jgi:hypothetical protein